MEIKFENVIYTIEKVNYHPKEIFKNLNISFQSSMIHGIIGKCGSGKTIMLELLVGLRKPNSGLISVPYKDIKKNISYMEESEDTSMFSNVIEWMQQSVYLYKSMSLTDIMIRIVDSLKMVGLDGSYLNVPVKTLSEGEKRKISLAISLFHNPKILVLDDPFRFLDTKSKNELCKLLKMLKNRYKKTIIVASNDIEMIHKIVDKLYILFNGEVVLTGDKYDVFKDTTLLKKYGIVAPKCIQFSNLVLSKKGIKIGYRNDINDLIKDIYRYSKW